MTHNPIRPWRNIERRKSRQIMVGRVPVGGDAPISVQTMTNTDGHDVRATLDQVIRAADAGADIVRISAIADRREREKAWADLDVRLQSVGAYVGLAERRSLYIAGSDVPNLSANEVIGGVVELADIAVRQ